MITRPRIQETAGTCEKQAPDPNGFLKKAIGSDARLAMVGGGGIKVAVHGYADMTGSREHNFRLSQKRADAVGDVIAVVRRGFIPAENITCVGMGPIVTSQASRNPLHRIVKIFLTIDP